MLSPSVGGRGADPQGFDIFWKPKSNSPPPGHLVNVKYAIYPLKFLTQQTILDVKIPTLGELHDVKFPWVSPPPPPHPGA